MKIEIHQDIIQQAFKCTKNLQCLSGKKEDICKIVFYMNDDMNFVKCHGDKGCPYLELHNKTELCNCPVRKEIFLRYKI